MTQADQGKTQSNANNSHDNIRTLTINNKNQFKPISSAEVRTEWRLARATRKRRVTAGAWSSGAPAPVASLTGDRQTAHGNRRATHASVANGLALPPPTPAPPGGAPPPAVVGGGGGGGGGHPAADGRESGGRGLRAAGPRPVRPSRHRHRLAPGGRRGRQDQQHHRDLLHRRLLRQVRRGRRRARHPARLQRARGAPPRGACFTRSPPPVSTLSPLLPCRVLDRQRNTS